MYSISSKEFINLCLSKSASLTRVKNTASQRFNGRYMCHKHFAPMAEGYITQILFKLANQRLAKAHAFVDIRIVVPLNLVQEEVGLIVLHSTAFTLGESLRQSFYMRLSGSQDQSGHERVKENLHLSSDTRDRTLAVQPVAKRLVV